MTAERTGSEVAAWHRVNISRAERGGRIILGLGAAVGGVLLLVVAASGFAMVLEILLVIAGLDLIVTGVTGHCPLYQRLGHTPRALKSR
jgi:hypothetical protein